MILTLCYPLTLAFDQPYGWFTYVTFSGLQMLRMGGGRHDS